MPELPDVETFKRYLDSTSLHQRISEVKVLSDRIIRGTSGAKIRSTLKGKEFDNSVRYGKHLFVNVDGGPSLHLHFGMTGQLQYHKTEKQPPDYARLEIMFDNDYELDYICKRMLGKVTLEESPDKFRQAESLGPDAMAVGEDDFCKTVSEHGTALKSFLMDQHTIAGIGNIYADEILYNSKIHPKTRGSDLEESDCKKVYHNMKKVLERAIEAQADASKMPRTWLLPHRRKGEDCPRCDGKIDVIKVNNRSTYFCPECQKKK